MITVTLYESSPEEPFPYLEDPNSRERDASSLLNAIHLTTTPAYTHCMPQQSDALWFLKEELCVCVTHSLHTINSVPSADKGCPDDS